MQPWVCSVSNFIFSALTISSPHQVKVSELIIAELAGEGGYLTKQKKRKLQRYLQLIHCIPLQKLLRSLDLGFYNSPIGNPFLTQHVKNSADPLT